MKHLRQRREFVTGRTTEHPRRVGESLRATVNRNPRIVRSADFLRPVWALLLRQDAKFTRIDLRSLERRNETEKALVVALDGPVVSMTTYGKRINSVYLTLESIARGTLLPSRFILWLQDEDIFRDAPSSLRRLQERGLEVRLTENYGPHTKYYPYLESAGAFEKPLVIADDDIVYPRTWLSGLMAGFTYNKNVVNCYRAHVMRLIDDRVAPYLSWRPCRTTEPSARHFATGVSGCIYPPALLEAIKTAGTGFLGPCPRADDIWLHANALRAGFEIKQIHASSLTFPFVPGTQGGGLSLSNVQLGQNDIQIRETYSSGDIESLLSTT